MNFNFRLVIDFSISSDSMFDFFIINPGNHTALSYCIETKVHTSLGNSLWIYNRNFINVCCKDHKKNNIYLQIGI